VVYASSGSAYGEALFGEGPLAEENPPVPDTLYSITKHASERICTRFRQARGLNVTCVRLGSVFGPWEHDTGVRDTLSIPLQILRLALRGEEIRLPLKEARRDWIYSRDVASGLVGILDTPSPRHEVYNLGSGNTWPDFSGEWCSCLRAVFPKLKVCTVRPGEAPNIAFLGDRDRAMMRIDRLVSETGFKPLFDQSRACADYVAWIRENISFFQGDDVGATRK